MNNQNINQATLTVNDSWVDGRPAFEVPSIKTDRGIGPRCPVGGGTFFYTSDSSRCFVAATKTAATYLRQRKYAKYLGRVQYSPKGIGHFEWEPK